MKRTFALKFSDYSGEPAKRKLYNEQLFDEVAPKYDFVTRALSLGRDAAWKRHLVEALPADLPRPNCVDLACGTGDVSRALAARYPDCNVTGVDLSGSMIECAKQRAHPSNVNFLQGDMCATGIDSDSVDIVTGGYALRSAQDLDKLLDETKRMLKPGGVAAFLEFSKPSARWLQRVEYWLLKTWGGFWGTVLHRNGDVYAYIAESLSTSFPDRMQLREQFEQHDLSLVDSRRFYFGMLEMYVLRK